MPYSSGRARGGEATGGGRRRRRRGNPDVGGRAIDATRGMRRAARECARECARAPAPPRDVVTRAVRDCRVFAIVARISESRVSARDVVRSRIVFAAGASPLVATRVSRGRRRRPDVVRTPPRDRRDVFLSDASPRVARGVPPRPSLVARASRRRRRLLAPLGAFSRPRARRPAARAPPRERRGARPSARPLLARAPRGEGVVPRVRAHQRGRATRSGRRARARRRGRQREPSRTRQRQRRPEPDPGARDVRRVGGTLRAEPSAGSARRGPEVRDAPRGGAPVRSIGRVERAVVGQLDARARQASRVRRDRVPRERDPRPRVVGARGPPPARRERAQAAARVHRALGARQVGRQGARSRRRSDARSKRSDALARGDDVAARPAARPPKPRQRRVGGRDDGRRARRRRVARVRRRRASLRRRVFFGGEERKQRLSRRRLGAKKTRAPERLQRALGAREAPDARPSLGGESGGPFVCDARDARSRGDGDGAGDVFPRIVQRALRVRGVRRGVAFPRRDAGRARARASRTIRRANAREEAANVAWYLAKMETHPEQRGGAAEWRRSGAFSASPSESSETLARESSASARRERGGPSRRRASLRAAALARLEHLAPRASLVEIAMAFWSHALLGEAPSGSLRAALEARLTTLVAREGAGVADPGAHKQNLSNLVWAYAKSRTRPSEAAWRALDLLADRTVTAFGTKDLCLAAWGYAALGRRPRSDATWARFNDALEKHADAFEPDELASAACARARPRVRPERTGRALRRARVAKARGAQRGGFRADGVAPGRVPRVARRSRAPPADPRRLVRREKTRPRENKENENPAESNPESFPFLAAARDAWRAQRQAQSASQRLVGDALTRLGVAHVPEHDFDADQATDFFLPAHDVAVEFDGPTHFYADERVPDARTRLRNLFLARRCRAIAALPYWGLEAARAEGGDDAVDRWVAREIERQTGADVRGNPAGEGRVDDKGGRLADARGNPAGGGRFEGRVRGIDYAQVDALIVDGFEDAAARWTRALPARRAADLGETDARGERRRGTPRDARRRRGGGRDEEASGAARGGDARGERDEGGWGVGEERARLFHRARASARDSYE